jgi:hypothetical protein
VRTFKVANFLLQARAADEMFQRTLDRLRAEGWLVVGGGGDVSVVPPDALRLLPDIAEVLNFSAPDPYSSAGRNEMAKRALKIELDERVTLVGETEAELMEIVVASQGRAYRVEATVRRLVRGQDQVSRSEPEWYPTLEGARGRQRDVVRRALEIGWRERP